MRFKFIVFSIVLFYILLIGTYAQVASETDEPIQTGPYPLTIPHKFGPGFKIPENNPLTYEGIALGRMLFYEKKLSRDNSISCGTCHQQRLAFTDGKAFSHGVHGKQGRRSSMSLANLLWKFKFFWDGRVSTLEEQALIPIQDTLEMNLPLDEAVAKLQNTAEYPAQFKMVFGTDQITAENIAKALAQFERILISSDSRYDKFLRGELELTEQEKLGMNLFMTHPEPANKLRGANCGDCHGTYKTSMHGIHNNGLDIEPKDKGRELVTGKETDRGKFRAPSLRNIALTAPYMHDGRFKTLEEVLDHYNEHIQSSATLDPLIIEATNQVGGATLLLEPEEKKAVLAFLYTLTDSTFITDKRFSDPYLKEVSANNKKKKK
ncbi:cytochrome-c peroxidase [Rhodocytophaga rosea]|uniref:Cytochrome-c peroxidase n=1 Tax=Rhodocytophaga rosea TaxID=2704465 RepID=A0A6C0GD47_9BACT|nr:cytochrome c peroxidase [Rhodocytophaga rosea]QHT65827.1 cytochrome-c peroxidase [Rhodocytophaga rosea]